MSFRPWIASLALVSICLAFAAPVEAQQQQRRRGQPAEQPRRPTEPEKTFPARAVWVLQEVNGKPVPPGVEATLMIDQNNRGTGSSGCNTWSATMLPIPGQRLAMGAVAMTRRTCPPSTLAFERAYLTALHSGPRWDLEASDLVVKAAATTLRFRRGL